MLWSWISWNRLSCLGGKQAILSFSPASDPTQNTLAEVGKVLVIEGFFLLLEGINWNASSWHFSKMEGFLLNDTDWNTDLKEKRLAYGVSQNKLAAAAGITRQYLGRIESGSAAPSEVELKGKGCRQFENFLLAQHRSWYDFFINALCEGGVFKRIDLAINDMVGILDIPELTAKCRNEEYTCLSPHNPWLFRTDA